MSKLLERIANVLKLGEVAEQSDVLPPRNRRWSEQGELWGGRSMAAESAKVQTADFDFSSTEIVRVARPQAMHAKKTQHGVSVTIGMTLPKMTAKRVEPISRFFTVNHTVQGDRGSSYRVIQAARQGVSADYDLWKGPTRQVTFLLG
jgi:hypothetical protein